MDTAVASPPAPVFKRRGNKPNIRKRPASPLPGADSDSSGYSSVEEDGQRIKRHKKSAVVSASSKHTASFTADISASSFTADRSSTIALSNDATKQSNWFDESESTSTNTKPTTTSTATESDKPTKKHTVGPIKAPTNIRTITITDFAPDVCKDYKTTGFCGFGDSCKFLHAREDYKQGWELDRDWDVTGKHSKSAPNTNHEGEEEEDDEDSILEGIPFACILCKEGYKSPIVTKCGHYFCEQCALDRYRRNPNCAACGAGTGGVFNGAKQLKKLLERKSEREKKKRDELHEDDDEE